MAGTDALAGDTVQIADFTAFAQTGRGFSLKVGKDSSHRFDFASDLYRRGRQRSG